jgi:hypothetical protein
VIIAERMVCGSSCILYVLFSGPVGGVALGWGPYLHLTLVHLRHSFVSSASYGLCVRFALLILIREIRIRLELYNSTF